MDQSTGKWRARNPFISSPDKGITCPNFVFLAGGLTLTCDLLTKRGSVKVDSIFQSGRGRVRRTQRPHTYSCYFYALTRIFLVFYMHSQRLLVLSFCHAANCARWSRFRRPLRYRRTWRRRFGNTFGELLVRHLLPRWHTPGSVIVAVSLLPPGAWFTAFSLGRCTWL